MDNSSIIMWVTSGLAVIAALAVIWRGSRSAANLLFAVGSVVFGLEAFFSARAISAITIDRSDYWHLLRLGTLAFVPGIWVSFSLCYSRGNYREFLKKWKKSILTFSILPVALVAFFQPVLIVSEPWSPIGQHQFLALGWAGSVLHLIVLVSCIVVLVNLERTFRASVGTMRWRIKLVVLALSIVFAVRIYTSSQAMLYRSGHETLYLLNAAAWGMACLLIGVSLIRTGLFSIDLYPSHTVLKNSLAAVLAGIYLLVVGALAKVVTWLGGDAAFPLKAFFVLVALVFLALLIMSDRFRQYLQRFVSRHLRRPSYDYRQVWQTFTNHISPQVTTTGLCSAVSKWVSETFNVLTTTVWLVDPTRQRLLFGASTSLEQSDNPELHLSKADFEEMSRSMTEARVPHEIEHSKAGWELSLKQFNPTQFEEKGGNRYLVPFVTGNELLGLMTLGDRIGGLSYTLEDLELLKCIGDQVAGSLLNTRLSEKLLQAKEMEAFQTMSTFFVHDLKNTASTLSLMLQNLPEHYDDPEFRKDVLKSTAKSVDRIKQLINQLSLLRQKLEIHPIDADLNEIVETTLKQLEATRQLPLTKSLNPVSRAKLDADQLHKVLTNLVLNAKEAIGEEGRIQVETRQDKNWLILSVSDNGCGMSREYIHRHLFRPFQTTKKKGMGIGLFHSKMIIEAHFGRIEVESELEKGTTFRIMLPINAPMASLE